ncbi:MAG: nucleoside triphosphate pyrophosphohydrolase [Oscillospiraceae bacterium]|nr:nucleoside triphosphate pyrophosphohydrolase [Oscillospiraceae bacterium]
MATYNKLVRDKIPEIISASGKKANCRILGKDEYIKELDRKLDEECAEYWTDKNIEELADILEVIYAIVEARGYSAAELERVRLEKSEKRGGFSQRIFLENVKDQN